jgi:hypothetical protein
MTYASEHLAYTFQGKLPSAEEWTITLRTNAAIASDIQCAGMALLAADEFTTMWNAANSFTNFNPTGVTLEKVVCRSITAAGLTVAQGEASPTVATNGTNSSHGSPNQVALVVTLQTARTGRTGRGRVYMPFLSPALGASEDHLSVVTTQPLADAFGDFVTAMNAITTGTSGPFTISVQSTVNFAAPPPVLSVRVGNVLDTQRRRRNKVVETYVSRVV